MTQGLGNVMVQTGSKLDCLRPTCAAVPLPPVSRFSTKGRRVDTFTISLFPSPDPSPPSARPWPRPLLRRPPRCSFLLFSSLLPLPSSCRLLSRHEMFTTTLTLKEGRSPAPGTNRGTTRLLLCSSVTMEGRAQPLARQVRSSEVKGCRT